jgi:hypothetical protein
MLDLIIGSHAWFARKGTTVDSVVVSSAALPVHASTVADWVKFPSIAQWQPKIDKTEVKLRAPITGGGKYGLRKTMLINSTLTHAFQLQEFSALEFELLFGAASINSGSGAFVPNSRTENIEGWVHVKNYNQDNEIIAVSDFWASISVEPFQFGEKIEPHALMAEVIANTLNAGVLTVANLS